MLSGNFVAIVFRSRIDAKFKVLTLALLGVSFMTLWLRPRPAPTALWGLMGLLMFGAAGFVLWITFTTYYELEHDALLFSAVSRNWEPSEFEFRG